MPVRLPVGLGTAVKTVSLDPTCEASAFGEPGGIDPIARLEQPNVKLLANFDVRDAFDLNLSQMVELLVNSS
jgi:hypothetical protein